MFIIIGMLCVVTMTVIGFYKAAQGMDIDASSGLPFLACLKWVSAGVETLLIMVFFQCLKDGSDYTALMVPGIVISVLFIGCIILEKFVLANNLRKKKINDYYKKMDKWK